MIQPALWRAPQFLRTRVEIALWNALLSYREVPLAVPGYHASFRFSAAEAPESTKSLLLVKAERGPHFVAVIERFPFDELHGVELETSDLVNLPAPLRRCLEEGMLSMIWQAVPHAGALGPANIVASGRLADLVSDTDDLDDYKWLSVSIDGIAPVPITLRIGFAPAAFAHLLSEGALARSIVARQLAASIDTDAYDTLGSLRLTYQDLLQLAPGDLVVLPHIPPDRLLIRSGDMLFTLSQASGQFLCVNKDLAERYKRPPLTAEETGMMDETIDQTQDIAHSLEELNVVIDFDIGRRTISLAELQSWQPGAAVLIEPPATDDTVSVTVRANGQIIGMGDLVKIDDRIGVRLTRLTFRHESGRD